MSAIKAKLASGEVREFNLHDAVAVPLLLGLIAGAAAEQADRCIREGWTNSAAHWEAIRHRCLEAVIETRRLETRA